MHHHEFDFMARAQLDGEIVCGLAHRHAKAECDGRVQALPVTPAFLTAVKEKLRDGQIGSEVLHAVGCAFYSVPQALFLSVGSAS